MPVTPKRDSSALAGERQFRRLQDLGKPLSEYRFSTVFVDPPRAGLDPATRALVGRFDRILYVSCNPSALARDLAALERSHRLVAAALFDQFPYTDHIECGVLMSSTRRGDSGSAGNLWIPACAGMTD